MKIKKEILPRQFLLWMPEGKDVGTFALRCEIAFSEKAPTRIWTLYEYTDKDKSPDLPFHPRHNINAFLEEKHHDWVLENNILRYFSRVCEGGVWLLLEYFE